MAEQDEQRGTADTGDSTAEPDLQNYAVLLRRMNAEFNRIAHDFAQVEDLHPTDVRALIEIMEAEPHSSMSPKELRERLQLTSGAVTACLDRLEKVGHIVRERDSRDRRVVHLRYEDSGRELARAHFRPLAQSTQAAMSKFTPAELRTVARSLHELNGQLKARPR